MKELLNELNKYLKDNDHPNLCDIVLTNGTEYIYCSIEDGDWKHDHAQLQYLVKKFFDEHPNWYLKDIIRKNYVGSLGDWYSQDYYFEVAPYEGVIEDEDSVFARLDKVTDTLTEDEGLTESWSRSTNEMIDAIDKAQFLLNDATLTEFENILKSCGANDDDSDPELGYFLGMSDEQILSAYKQVKELLQRVIRNMSSTEINNRFFSYSNNATDILDAFDLELNHKGDLIESLYDSAVEYISKETSYEVAQKIARMAKLALKLPAHEVDMLEHDINNLRAHEWVDSFSKLSDKSEVKRMFFTYAVRADDGEDYDDDIDESLCEDFKDAPRVQFPCNGLMLKGTLSGNSISTSGMVEVYIDDSYYNNEPLNYRAISIYNPYEDRYIKDNKFLVPEDKIEYINDRIEKTKICVICGRPYTGYGNNAAPVAEGQCCDECNISTVIPLRFQSL